MMGWVIMIMLVICRHQIISIINSPRKQEEKGVNEIKGDDFFICCFIYYNTVKVFW